jgi:hypothetical protein
MRTAHRGGEVSPTSDGPTIDSQFRDRQQYAASSDADSGTERGKPQSVTQFESVDLGGVTVHQSHPRGAFLWPIATANALGLSAAGPQSEERYSVAALELLAAKAVADISAFPNRGRSPSANRRLQGDAASSLGPMAAQLTVPSDIRFNPLNIAPASSVPSVNAATGAVNSQALSGLVASSAMAPANSSEQFQQFHALFLRAAGSPAVRAAQALAMITKAAAAGNSAMPDLRDRAALAWDVMPMVSAAYLVEQQSAQSQSATSDELTALQLNSIFENGGLGDVGNFDMVAPGSDRGVSAAPSSRQSRAQTPWFARMSGGVGQALGSLVKRESRSSSGDWSESWSGDAKRGESARSRTAESMTQVENIAAVRRPPTAAAEMVRTGTAARASEAELPSWFEAAARKMFGEQSALTDGISLADMTLIQSAPAQQIAASTVGETAASTPSSTSSASHNNAQQAFDVESIARDVYRAVLQIMDSVRARNGEPYL